MGITAVNVNALPDLRKTIAALTKPALLESLARRMGAAAIKQLADEYRESRDPYGEKWAPVFRNRKRDRDARKGRDSGGRFRSKADKPLIDTGRMRAASIASSANHSSGASVRLMIPVEYASYHQHGTARMQRRQILPEDATGGLGPRWSRAFNAEAKRLLAEIAGK